jgi:hypothetical protein
MAVIYLLFCLEIYPKKSEEILENVLSAFLGFLNSSRVTLASEFCLSLTPLLLKPEVERQE